MLIVITHTIRGYEPWPAENKTLVAPTFQTYVKALEWARANGHVIIKR